MDKCEDDLERRGIHLLNATNHVANKREMSSWELLAQVELVLTNST